MIFNNYIVSYTQRTHLWKTIQVFLLSLLVLIFEPVAAQESSALSTHSNSEIKKPTSRNNQPNSFDLDEIKKRGTLRIIVPSNLSGGLFLPRADSPMDKQRGLAVSFARSMGLEPKIVPVLSFKDMLPTLNEGRGDIIVANITVTEKRKKKLAFSVPVAHAHEVVLVSSTKPEIKITKDLANKSLLLNKDTSFWKTGLDYKKRYPSIKLTEQKKGLFDEQGLDLVAEGKFDATIRDSNIAEMYLNYRDDLRIAFKASSEQSIAFALRKNSIHLKSALDNYLAQAKLATHHAKEGFGDLSDIKKRGILRVLLRNNASSYFLRRGQLMGFEYEMAQAFAKHLGVRLVVLVPPSGEESLDWLESGKVDIAAGFLTPSSDWKERGINSSTPYHQAFQHIVVHKDQKALKSVEDLDGKTVVVHKSSTYWKELEALKSVGINVILEAASEELEVEEIIEGVANKKYEITVADEHLLDIEKANYVSVKSAFTIGDLKAHTLAVRGEDSALMSSINRYISSKKDGRLYSRLYNKYFADRKQVRKLQSSRLKTTDGKKMISKYDRLVQKYSDKYGFDWRFITAQMFQESRFDPNARSHAGAIGLMQIMPATGRQLGLSSLNDPVNNIHAGTKYMHWLYKKFESDLPVVDRMWFTLASYNAGLGHVMDARRLAKQQGLNENRWFGNVEKAMLLLSKAKYAKKARFGYVRGREPVGYVRIIMKLYASYINVVDFDERLSMAPIDFNSADREDLYLKKELDRLYADLENHPTCCR